MNNQKLFVTEIEVDGFGVVVVRMHYRSHYDEVVAYMLISQLADAEWCRHYCPNGKIDIGFGGGWLDDHAEAEISGEEESCAMIVAKSFGVEASEDYKEIVEYAHFEDNNRTRHKDSIANLLWLMQQFWPEQEEDNLNWALAGTVELIGKGELDFRINHISAKFDDPFEGQEWRLRGEEIQIFQQKIFMEALREIKSARENGSLLLYRITFDGKSMLAAAIVSDNLCVAKAMQWNKGLAADIVVVRSRSGHFYVTADNRRGITLGSVVAVLRIEEQRAAKSIKVTDWRRLESVGTLSNVPEWHFFVKGGMLMNGSLTRPEVPKSKLSLKKVLGCVVLALNPGLWQESKTCQDGSCAGRDCPWYLYGLDRCRVRRMKLVYAADRRRKGHYRKPAIGCKN